MECVYPQSDEPRRRSKKDNRYTAMAYADAYLIAGKECEANEQLKLQRFLMENAIGLSVLRSGRKGKRLPMFHRIRHCSFCEAIAGTSRPPVPIGYDGQKNTRCDQVVAAAGARFLAIANGGGPIRRGLSEGNPKPIVGAGSHYFLVPSKSYPDNGNRNGHTSGRTGEV